MTKTETIIADIYDAWRAPDIIAHQFDPIRFDTSDLMIRQNRAGLEIPLHYRHRTTGSVARDHDGQLLDVRGRLAG